jgi:O-antigen ligase
MSFLRAGVCLLITFAVLAFGAVQVWSQSILEIGAAVLLIVWALLALRYPAPKIEWNDLNWPLLGLIAIGLLQLAFGGTAYAFLTRSELLRFGAYFVIFFLLEQLFCDRSTLAGLGWYLIVLCFAVSLLGISQHFTSEKEIYWMSSLVIRGDSFGPYVNRNHFAGFVELTLPVGLALIIFRGVRKDLLPLLIVLTIVPISALVLAGSRAGIIGFAFELCLLAGLARFQGHRGGSSFAVLGGAALAALALVGWLGADKAIQRFSTQSTDVALSRRISMFRGTAHVFFDHPIKGSGMGTLVSVYPRYETMYDGLVVDHAHNEYIEALAETGILGGFCGVAFLILLYRNAIRGFSSSQTEFGRALRAGAIVAVSGLLLHSFFDFNLHIPSNALLFLVQAFVATSAPIRSEAHRRRTAGNREPSSEEMPRLARAGEMFAK